MKILLVYSSRTGNTKKVAEALGEELGISAVPVEEKPAAADFDLVIAGFWVDRGTADAKMKAYLESLREVRVAIFATLGAKADSEHAAHCLEAGTALVGKGSKVVGKFICQGKVDQKVAEAMFKQFPAGHTHAMSPAWAKLFQEGATHPDEQDLAAARDYFSKLVREL